MKNIGDTEMIRLGVAQMEPTINDNEGNMVKMLSVLDYAKDQDIDVLVLPERINTSYAFKNRKEVLRLSENIPEGPFSKELARWTKKGGMVIAGLSEKDSDGAYDAAVLFSEGKHLSTYRKLHLYDDDVDWFKPGQEDPPVVEYKGYLFSVTLGYDFAFPELTRALVLRGTQVLLHMTNLMLSYNPKVMISRSIENRIFTAVASRTGDERGFRFIGGSQITDPRGHVLARMNKTENGVVWVEIDPAVADKKTIGKRSNVLKDRRPQFYKRIIEDT